MTETASPPPGRAILGGSFNLPHVGHMRLAIEAREALGDLVQGVDMVPCAVPPHKAQQGMLPFELRARMVEACAATLPWLRCNRVEALRQGPSFTWDTLCAYHEAEPGTDFYFILGSPDFAMLSTWHRGVELPRLCNFVVVPRKGHTAEDFIAAAKALWPQAQPRPSVLPSCACVALPGGGLAHFLSVPWLAVSASRVRQLWLAGRNVDFLVPDAALRILRDNSQTVRQHWLKESLAC